MAMYDYDLNKQKITIQRLYRHNQLINMVLDYAFHNCRYDTIGNYLDNNELEKLSRLNDLFYQRNPSSRASRRIRKKINFYHRRAMNNLIDEEDLDFNDLKQRALPPPLERELKTLQRFLYG